MISCFNISCLTFAAGVIRADTIIYSSTPWYIVVPIHLPLYIGIYVRTHNTDIKQLNGIVYYK